LYDPAMAAPELDPTTAPEPLAAHAWRPVVAGVREVFHARFPDHAYPRHTHSVWTLFVVDEGAVRYDLERRDHVAAPTMLSVLPPHLAHDGRPATGDGYAMRVLYLEPGILGEELIGAAVDRPIVSVAGLGRRLDRLHAALACRDDALEAEELLAALVADVRLALQPEAPATGLLVPRGRPVLHAARSSGDLADGLRAHLERRLFEPVTIAAAALELGVEPTRLARAFASTFGLPPHAWVTSRRLEVARGRILDGAPIADVAAEVGFADQAHLTRRFRQLYGTTPAALRGRGAGANEDGAGRASGRLGRGGLAG
jgi:AraC-like DNA-binding protein